MKSVNIFIPGMMIPKRDCTELILKSDGRIYIRADLEDGEHVIPTEHYATEINCQPADVLPQAWNIRREAAKKTHCDRPVVRAEWKNEMRLKDENGSLEWHGICSHCLMQCSAIGACAERMNFCPNCGADMSGGGEE